MSKVVVKTKSEEEILNLLTVHFMKKNLLEMEIAEEQAKSFLETLLRLRRLTLMLEERFNQILEGR